MGGTKHVDKIHTNRAPTELDFAYLNGSAMHRV